MDFNGYLRDFEQLEADAQAAEVDLRSGRGSMSSHVLGAALLMTRYRLLSATLSRDRYLSEDVRLQELDTRVLAVVARLNAAVFRTAAGHHA